MRTGRPLLQPTPSALVNRHAEPPVRSNHAVYDAGGRMQTLFHPYLASAGAPNNGATTHDYHLNGSSYLDPLGRVYRTINPIRPSAAPSMPPR
jgi:hypothetical protein